MCIIRTVFSIGIICSANELWPPFVSLDWYKLPLNLAVIQVIWYKLFWPVTQTLHTDYHPNSRMLFTAPLRQSAINQRRTLAETVHLHSLETYIVGYRSWNKWKHYS